MKKRLEKYIDKRRHIKTSGIVISFAISILIIVLLGLYINYRIDMLLIGAILSVMAWGAVFMIYEVVIDNINIEIDRMIDIYDARNDIKRKFNLVDDNEVEVIPKTVVDVSNSKYIAKYTENDTVTVYKKDDDTEDVTLYEKFHNLESFSNHYLPKKGEK